MPEIELKTIINAPIMVCFDLCRSIDLHMISTSHTNERAVGGVTSGLIDLGETVTWRAKHFGIYQNLTSKITVSERPYLFVDEMVKGAFKSFRHAHRLEEVGKEVHMVDVFDYQSPMGVLGRFFDAILLKNYMRELLIKRNNTIKEYAENGQWKKILPTDSTYS